jgi:hypothetical protein
MTAANQVHTSELARFVQFALQYLERGLPVISPEELVAQWRTIERIERNTENLAAGEGITADEAFRRIRAYLKGRQTEN